jgi:hypothetical protein
MDEIAFFKLTAAFLGGCLAGYALFGFGRNRRRPDSGPVAVVELDDNSRTKEVGFQILNKIGCFLEANDNNTDRIGSPTPLQDSGPRDMA